MSGISNGFKPAAALSGSLLISKGGARPGQRYDNEITEVYQSRRRISLSAERVRDLSDFHGTPEAVVAEDETTAMVESPLQDSLRVEPALHMAQPPSDDAGAEKLPGARSIAGKTRVAYTVRLDTHRHAQLRFTAAHQNRSAQQVMLDALDRYLSVAVPFLQNDK